MVRRGETRGRASGSPLSLGQGMRDDLDMPILLWLLPGDMRETLSNGGSYSCCSRPVSSGLRVIHICTFGMSAAEDERSLRGRRSESR